MSFEKEYCKGEFMLDVMMHMRHVKLTLCILVMQEGLR